LHSGSEGRENRRQGKQKAGKTEGRENRRQGKQKAGKTEN
jgi:hypothetical protein